MTAPDARRALAFALDYPDLEAARRGAARVAEHVGVLKVGLELFVREGPRALDIGVELNRAVFLDLKLHDIPETVARAVERAAELGAAYLTLHAAGGARMLEFARERVDRLGSGLKLLAITVLTSLSDADLLATGVTRGAADHARALARLARDAGAHGCVCSVLEVRELRRELGRDAWLVTPGIRPGGAGGDDQKRTGSVEDAVHGGADLLVVGRPIRDAADPAAAARDIAERIAAARSSAATP